MDWNEAISEQLPSTKEMSACLPAIWDGRYGEKEKGLPCTTRREPGQARPACVGIEWRRGGLPLAIYKAELACRQYITYTNVHADPHLLVCCCPVLPALGVNPIQAHAPSWRQ